MKVYHISFPTNRESVLEFGLLPKESDIHIIYELCIFVFCPLEEDDVTFAFYYTSNENMDIWELEINCKNLNNDKVSNAKNHFWINYLVMPKLYKTNVNLWQISLKDFIIT